MSEKIIRGILSRDAFGTFIKSADGTEYFSDAAIWEGYIKHWQGQMLCGRLLPEKDYISGKPAVLLWPEKTKNDEPFVELYYNEQLVKYFISILGHSAINVNGNIFNFSQALNECEIMSEEEYFYRPALGRFSPSPDGRFDTTDPDKPYLDKFGRQFMRKIHSVRITGRETESLESILRGKLKKILNTPADPANPEEYADFNRFTNSCTTIVRDSLREWGFPGIKGIFPRELFINAVWTFYKESKKEGFSLSVAERPQLVVDEAPVSRLTPAINPVNFVKKVVLQRRGIPV